MSLKHAQRPRSASLTGRHTLSAVVSSITLLAAGAQAHGGPLIANQHTAGHPSCENNKCIEDCGHCVRILDQKIKQPDGYAGGAIPRDPEDEKVRARVLVRKGTCLLWLGKFSEAAACYRDAIDKTDNVLKQQPHEAVLSFACS